MVSFVILHAAQQLTGINAIFYYSNSFFVGIIDNPLVGTTLVGVVNVVATYVALQLMDKTGRVSATKAVDLSFLCALVWCGPCWCRHRHVYCLPACHKGLLVVTVNSKQSVVALSCLDVPCPSMSM